VRWSADIRELRRTIKRRIAQRKLLRLQTQDRPSTAGYEVAVYFGDPDKNLYQLRQWIKPLKQLSADVRLVCVFRSADSALEAIRDKNFSLPIVYAGRHSDLDPLVERNNLKVVFYVNHHLRNLAMLSQPRVLHVYLGHGESDKVAVSASNQLKAYDFTFVAGQAAIDRVKRRLINFNAQERLIPIGRPQVDFPAQDSHFAGQTSKQFTLLYAPSWEGDRVSNAYGSVKSHGRTVIEDALADGRTRIIFRPHPLTGDVGPGYAKAARELTERIDSAAARDPEAGHITDTSDEFGWQLEVADLCIADVSAAAFDWLATGKPLVITQPSEPLALVDPASAIARLPLWSSRSKTNVIELLLRQLSGETAADLDTLRQYCFGDSEPGAAMLRFTEATQEIIRIRDREVELLSQY
jgi:hypothetical protein